MVLRPGALLEESAARAMRRGDWGYITEILENPAGRSTVIDNGSVVVRVPPADPEAAKMIDHLIGTRTALPGTYIPETVVSPIEAYRAAPGSVVVGQPTPLGDLLRPNAGVIQVLTCQQNCGR